MNPSHLFRQTAFLARTTFRRTQHDYHSTFRRKADVPSPSILRNIVRGSQQRPPLHPSRRRLFSSKPDTPPKYDPTPHLKSPEPALSLSQRLRKLSREYGWSALGVYLLLSALDFPFCFIAVRALGTERIGEWEHAVVDWVKKAVPIQIPPSWTGTGRESVEVAQEAVGDTIAGYDHGVKEAEVANKGEKASMSQVFIFSGHPDFMSISRHHRSFPLTRNLYPFYDWNSIFLLTEPHVLGIWTQLALAYAIHKSFIFVRVPLTAAVLPKVVRVLRGWGWNIGKRKSKSAAAGAVATGTSKS
ncbi:hypothetical protein MMC19_006374 [Ptychographa xylographoides]|nr:hypothetical protein [Ptychographa xylographoides]